MANVANSLPGHRFISSSATPNGTFYAVYDSCVANNIPSRDVAFIEERRYMGNIYEQASSDEKYFRSLSDAKAYVKDHFLSGAEYFSLNQSVDPDNVLHAIIDKITYLIA